MLCIDTRIRSVSRHMTCVTRGTDLHITPPAHHHTRQRDLRAEADRHISRLGGEGLRRQGGGEPEQAERSCHFVLLHSERRQDED